jgi:O-antigen/teichoic acid export membrane protein
MLLAVASLRYEAAIPIPAGEEEAADLLSLSLLVAVAVASMVGVLCWAAGRPLTRLLRVPELHPYLWLVPAGVLAAGMYQALSSWAVRARAYPVLARTRLAQGAGQVGVQLALGFAGVGPVGLLAGDVVGRAGGTGTLASATLPGRAAVLRGTTLARLRAVAVRYRRFPQLSSPAALLNALGLQLPTLLFVALYGPSVAGWMALGQRVVGVPMRVVGQALAQVYLGEAARIIREEPARLPVLFNRLARRLAWAGAIPIAAIGLAGPTVFPWFFGEEWREAGWYVLLLAPTVWAQFVVSPLSQTVVLAERQGAQLAVDVLRTVAVVAGVIVPWTMGTSARVAVAVYAGSMMVIYVASFILYRSVVREVARRAAIDLAASRPSAAG